MWGPDVAGAFERDGHVTLKGAFDPTAADRMSEAIWRYVESRTDIRRRVSPPRSVKLFSVVEPLHAHGGATMVLAGTPNLQAAYARNAADDDRAGDKQRWHRFMRRTDPWLARFLETAGAPERSRVLSQPQVIEGQRVELRELGGEPGDVHVCHINLFHSVAPNASDQPRVMVTHAIRPAGDTDG